MSAAVEEIHEGSRVRSGEGTHGRVLRVELVPVRDVLGRVARVEEKVFVDWGAVW